MRCYYQMNDEKWHRGCMFSREGDLKIEFVPLDSGSPGVVLYRPEILFFDDEVHVTGWARVNQLGDDRLHKLQRVDVRFIKPRKKP